jgi:hypothetical protein
MRFGFVQATKARIPFFPMYEVLLYLQAVSSGRVHILYAVRIELQREILQQTSPEFNGLGVLQHVRLFGVVDAAP